MVFSRSYRVEGNTAAHEPAYPRTLAAKYGHDYGATSRLIRHMSYMSSVIEGVHVVRWIKAEPGDVVPVLREFQDACEKAGRPIIGVAIISNAADPPSQETTRQMGVCMTDLVNSAESIHFVMEGAGFRHTIRRTAVAGVLLLGGKRGKVTVHATIEEAVLAIAPQIQIRPAEFLGRLRHLGLVRQTSVHDGLK